MLQRLSALFCSPLVLACLAAPCGPVMASDLDADALARRLGGFTPRAGPGVTIEDEWNRPEVTCTPIAERDALPRSSQEAARGAFHDDDAKVIRRPRVDLEVNFAFGSTELLADAVDLLATLAEALEKDRLEDQRFLLVGHTDAVGSEAANQALSEARAQAVLRHLSEVQGIASDRLKARGCGERMLLDRSDPQSPRNRRVEVINAGP